MVWVRSQRISNIAIHFFNLISDKSKSLRTPLWHLFPSLSLRSMVADAVDVDVDTHDDVDIDVHIIVTLRAPTLSTTTTSISMSITRKSTSTWLAMSMSTRHRHDPQHVVINLRVGVDTTFFHQSANVQRHPSNVLICKATRNSCLWSCKLCRILSLQVKDEV